MTILAQIDLTASTNNAVYTSADAKGDVVRLMFTNRNTSGSVLVNIWLVPNGQSSPTNAMLIHSTPLDAQCWAVRDGIALGDGDQIFANPGAAGISMSVVGLPI